MCAEQESRGKIVFDEIGRWSEVKLDILKNYAQAYSKILAKQPNLVHVYIDAFAGPGQSVSRTTRGIVPGSPLIVLDVQPRFAEYYFVEENPAKAQALRELAGGRQETIHIYEGDCNDVLIHEVFPRVQWKDLRRGLCLLDPYGLTLDWKVVETAGRMGTVDLILNFPVMDMNRNVFWRNPEGVDEADLARMNRFWGDESWRDVVYDTRGDLFGKPEKQSNEIIAVAFKERLRQVAAFAHVAPPIPMRNSKGAVVYYLFFALPKPVALKIASYISDKYRNWT